jgi:uncharacterized spore protein YtfJ
MSKKVCFTLLAVSLFLFSGQLQAQEKSAVDEAFVSFDKMMSIIKVSSVIGKPIQSENTIVIPFSKISFGLGAGGAMMGFGGGMGGKAVALGVLVIEGEDVRVELFPLEEKKPSFLQQMLPVLIQYLPQILKQKFPSPPSPAPASKPEKETGKPEKPVKEGSLDQAKKLFDEERYPEALELVEGLIAKEPNNAELHAWKGNIMGSMAKGNPLDMMKYGMGAMQAFEKALQLDPNNVDAHFGRGIGRLMAPEGFGGDVNGAIEDFEFVCKKKPSPEAFYQLGVAYKKKGQVNEAQEAFKKALELKPDYPEAAKALAEIK